MPTESNDVVLVGLGQMGSVFAHAFLREGHTVHPVNRETDTAALAERVPEPAICMVTVGEADLDGVLEGLPESWRNRVGLLQNELLPRSWERHGIDNPTVAVVWFEKKPTIATKVILPSPIAGPEAPLISRSLLRIGVGAEMVEDSELVPALVAKNLYILVANCAGLETGGTVGELFENHRPLVDAVAAEVLAIQKALVTEEIDDREVMRMVERAVASDPEHGAKGRSAPARLKRAIAHAEEHGVEVPKLKALAEAHLI
jgi:ketopantoate reductase